MADIPLVSDPAAPAIPVYAVTAADWPAFSGAQDERVRALAEAQGFKAQPGRLLTLADGAGRIEAVFVGMGDGLSPAPFGAAAAQAPPATYRLASRPAQFSAEAMTLAWALGGYAFTRYKARARPPARLLAPEDSASKARVLRTVEAVHLVRDLVNTPAGDMGPEALHQATEAVARAGGARFTAVVGEALLAQNFPMIHAVGRAAAEPPRLLRLDWGEESHPRVTLVGKGITFDTGGLNMKTGAGMALMKKDMGGAAHVLGLAQALMAMNAPIRLTALLAVAENAISGAAFRPGDILQSRKGLTVEIDNTDAEGRLVLADALTLACEESPALLLDFATLTGAARVALGAELAPFYTEDEALAADLERAAKAAHDPLWRMPLWRPYEAELDSPIADMKNSGDGQAGSITAALFLSRFVTTKNWAHFDIYAWNPKERPGRPQGGEATALRATLAMLEARYVG